MLKIKVPELFESLLTDSLEITVNTAIISLQDIYADNKLQFFPDFTDHGIQHIEAVLSTSANLIEENTFEYLNSDDIGVLIISILLHDLGMHISSDGLKKLLDGEFDDFRVKEFDSKTWKEEWNDFFHEAKRFNDVQLMNIFGTTDIDFDEPDLDSLNDYSIRLYGEFIRRHHHRLAHEIALAGFPTIKGTQNLIIGDEQEQDIMTISGLVARSHGIDLRDTFEFLKVKFFNSWKAPYDIKVIFLMAVLRISDYIQIEKERASSLLLKVKNLKSPFSGAEWEKHNSIKFIDTKADDPELIYVVCEPLNSKTYLDLAKLFKSIQYEFDLSWAVLGEVYGRHEYHKNLKIKFRRLKSNIDNKVQFQNSVNYITEKIAFEADPELLKLLIGPLYGENARYGVRELLQNSVDAIKEREFIDRSFTGGKITVILDEVKNDPGKYFIKLIDNGIGMSKDTIIQYFFTAGASFRKSMVWKKNFVEQSEAQIERTGRFGVGVLAVFLMGDSFKLETRYHTDELGYSCEASLSTKQVELVKNKDCNIGTSITILLNDELSSMFNESKLNTRAYLDWFLWYCFEFPKMEIKMNKDLLNLFQFRSKFYSSNPNKPSNGWYRFNSVGFNSIHWSLDFATDVNGLYGYESIDNYRNRNELRNETLVCNGFVIPTGYQVDGFPWVKPSISVFDGNARMPLSLNRDYLLENRVPFERDLIRSVFHLLMKNFLEIEFVQCGGCFVPKPKLIKFKGGTIDISNYVLVQDSTYVLHDSIIANKLGIKRFYKIYLKNKKEDLDLKLLPSKSYYHAKIQDLDTIAFYNNCLDPYRAKWEDKTYFNLGKEPVRSDLVHHNYLLSNKYLYLIEKGRLKRKTLRDNHNAQLVESNNDWIKLSFSAKDLDEDAYSVRVNYGFIMSTEASSKKSKQIENSINHLEPNLKEAKNHVYLIKEVLTDIENQPIRGFPELFEYWLKNIGHTLQVPIELSLRPKL